MLWCVCDAYTTPPSHFSSPELCFDPDCTRAHANTHTDKCVRARAYTLALTPPFRSVHLPDQQCMRELAATGWMSNRGRQNAASFLSKQLGIDWRLGGCVGACRGAARAPRASEGPGT